MSLPSQDGEHETEYNLATMVENSKGVMKGDPSQFELLKVLGQGSFGKVSRSWVLLGTNLNELTGSFSLCKDASSV